MLKAVFLFASQLWKLRSDSHCVHDKTPHVSVFFNGQQTPANSGGLVTFVFDTKKPLYYPCLLLIEVQKWSSKTHHFDTPNTTWPWAEQSLANVWSRRQALPRSGVNICQTYRVEKDWWPQAVGWVKSHSIHSIHSIPSTPVIHCLTWHTMQSAMLILYIHESTPFTLSTPCSPCLQHQTITGTLENLHSSCVLQVKFLQRVGPEPRPKNCKL